MHLKLIVIVGIGVAEGGIASAASVAGYLRLQGPSPIRLAGVRPAAVTRPVLPPLAWGDEADQPPAPRNFAAFRQNGVSDGAPSSPDAGAGGGARPFGPELPAASATGDAADASPDNSTPANPADGNPNPAPLAPGTLLPFFAQPGNKPGGGRSNVVVPLQFTPAPPPAFRSSTATFTKE